MTSLKKARMKQRDKMKEGERVIEGGGEEKGEPRTEKWIEKDIERFTK